MILVPVLSDNPGCPLAGAMRALPPAAFRVESPPLGKKVFPAGRTVAVLDDEMTAPPAAVPSLPAGCPAILSGQNPAAARLAGEQGLTPLDCGLSLRDTLTLSSLTESSVVVSLQRPVVRLDGTALEPVELPLTLTRPWEPYPLLCCAGVLLLAAGPAALAKSGVF